MAQKNKPNVAGASLRKFIVEALKERERSQEKLPAGAPVPLGPGWPYFDLGMVGAKVTAELGPPEKSAQEIKRRLKQFCYPYEMGTKNQKAFYQHVLSLGLLQPLISFPLLWHIRFFWWLERTDFYLSKLHGSKRSEFGLPLATHKALAILLSAHLRDMEKLVKKHIVSRNKKTEVWFQRFKDYRSGVLKQLLNEAAIYYPQVRYFQTTTPKSATDDWRRLARIEAEVAVLEAVQSTLRAHDKKSDKLAYQLTALFCTSQKHIKDNELSPTPQTIRLNAKWLKNQQKVGVSIKGKKSA